MLRRKIANICFNLSQKRSIIIPKQLKAYGGVFSRTDKGGERQGPSLVPMLQNVNAIYKGSQKNRRTACVDDFSEMGVDSSIRSALISKFGITSPSPIQQMVVPTGISGSVAVLAASESGSGKTLACILPAYCNMVRDRDVYGIPSREFRPRMIILAPTREVLKQIHSVCKKLDDATGLRSFVMTRTRLMKRKLKKLLREGSNADVVVMHPHMVLKLLRHRRLSIEDLRYLVVDEADEMLSSGQEFHTQQLLAKIQRRILYKHLPPVETQIYFATTGLTKQLTTFLNKKYPYAVHCVTKRVHSPPENIKFRFYPVEKTELKIEMLEFLLNNKTKNYPLRNESESEKTTSATLNSAQILNNNDGIVINNEIEDSTTYKDWLSSKCTSKKGDGASEPFSSKNQSLSLGLFPSEVLLDTSSVNTYSSCDLKGFPKSLSASKRDDETRNRLRSEVSKALVIPTTRKYGSAGLIRPSLRWENTLTHASPFQFFIPQRFVPQSGLRVLIFTHSIDSCAAVYFKLKHLGYGVTLLHASLPEGVRNEMLESFASGRCNIMVCTNILSRGVDMPVDVVINFDLPLSAPLFLNRAGRCGRMGRPGICYSIVHAKKDRVMTSALQALVNNGIGLHGVSNIYSHMTRPRYSEWSVHHKNKLARAYVQMISKASIPSSLVKTYIKHNAMWRPIFRPHGTAVHAGVAPRQQDRIMASVIRDAIDFRKGQLANRKGGRAKFGSKGNRRVWSWKGAIHTHVKANAEGSDAVFGSAKPIQ